MAGRHEAREWDSLTDMSLAAERLTLGTGATGSGPGRSRLAEPAADRGRAFRRARRHSLMIRLLRLLLPVAAVASLAAYLLAPDLSLRLPFAGGEVAVEKFKITSDSLKMLKPRFEGFTKEDGRYLVTAAAARQDLKNPDVIDLESIDATLTEKDNGWSKLVAKTGVYQVKKQQLKLTGDILATSSDGLKARLSEADLDIRDKRLMSRAPVAIEMPNGTIEARGLELLSEERHIIFKRKVKAHLLPPPPKPAVEGDAAAVAGKAGKPKPKAPTLPGFAAAGGDAPEGPIDITADRLEVKDKAKRAEFSGDVVAVQGGMTLASSELIVTYTGSAGPGAETPAGAEAGSGSAELATLEAKTNVRISGPDGRTATADRSYYDRVAGTMLLEGRVVLQQAGSRLEGPKVEIDIATRTSRFPPGGRVIGHFAPEAAAAATGKAEAKAKPKPAAKSGPLGPVAGGLAGFGGEESSPIDISSGALEVFDDKGLAVFKGDVVATRGQHRITANVLEVRYKSAGSGGPSGDLTRLDAKERVVVTAPDNQVSTSDWLVYDAAAQTITIGGNVTVSQGENVIKGEKLLIDLKTGQSHFVTEGGGEAAATGKKRIKMLITREGVKPVDPGALSLQGLMPTGKPKKKRDDDPTKDPILKGLLPKE